MRTTTAVRGPLQRAAKCGSLGTFRGCRPRQTHNADPPIRAAIRAMLASQFRGNAMRLRQFGLMLSAVACLAPVGCLGRVAHNLPPSQRLMEPGPGVGGPGPGVIQPASAMLPMG